MLDAWPADEEDGGTGAVLGITHEFQRGGRALLGFIDIQKYNVLRESIGLIGFSVAGKVPSSPALSLDCH
ncbi:hypothetical protein [Glutamicibacter arilaitensis]|uniref:hypothetical protein n=1 Tax=Glutamicibacter arilaitensis TaxID=256701 RepID=UPI00384CF5E0